MRWNPSRLPRPNRAVNSRPLAFRAHRQGNLFQCQGRGRVVRLANLALVRYSRRPVKTLRRCSLQARPASLGL